MQIALYGGLITISTLGVFLWALANAPVQAVTMSFMTLALAQVFHLGNARSHQPVLRPVRAFANRYAVGAIMVSVLLQIASVQLAPLGSLLRVTSLGLRQWLIVLAFSSATAVVGQVIRTAAPPRSLNT
jgi:Ca2+-transporting ATPase